MDWLPEWGDTSLFTGTLLFKAEECILIRPNGVAALAGV